MATEECPVHEDFKQNILKADDTGTVVTGTSIKMPVRSIQNELTTTYLKKESEQATKDELEKLTKDSLIKAVQGNVEEGTLMAGEISGLITEIRTCKDVIQELVHLLD